MVPLLTLDAVTKSVVRGHRTTKVMDSVSLEVMAGEIVGVWGGRRSGRSTLLRVAAGIEPADSGTVRVAGRALDIQGQCGLDERIGLCHTRFSSVFGTQVIDHVAVPLLARGRRLHQAHADAADVLDHVGAGACIHLRPEELDAAETVRVGIARALVRGPSVLLVDEPTLGVEILDRDPLLRLLRTIANEGTAVLFTTGETAALAAADRACSIDAGVLRGDPPAAPVPVTVLRPRQQRDLA